MSISARVGIWRYFTRAVAAIGVIEMLQGMRLLEGDFLPFVMAVAFAAIGSFIIPYGYQTHLMVYHAGRYRLTDFVNVGAPVNLIYSTIALTTVPLFLPF